MWKMPVLTKMTEQNTHHWYLSFLFLSHACTGSHLQLLVQDLLNGGAQAPVASASLPWQST